MAGPEEAFAPDATHLTAECYLNLAEEAYEVFYEAALSDSAIPILLDPALITLTVLLLAAAALILQPHRARSS